ncbi:MAG: AAA family ATPase [Gammaproteobacteria bacterium]
MELRNRAMPSAHATQAETQAVIAAASRIVVGKATEIRLALACLLARGHLLIEDLPGVGKTTLAHLLARLLGLGFQRIQFTSDLLPADITGVYVYDRDSGEFRFHAGPVFTNVVLADEINRATPRAQSALLEAMEEGQVTVENHTHSLPQPFFVIATQNPLEQIGTFPLPESQLDRFLMCISLGYPDRAAERALLTGSDRRTLLAEQEPVLDAAVLGNLQAAVLAVHVSDALIDYVQELLDHTRTSSSFATGLSPRAGLALLRAARAWALIDGRNHVLPDDIQAVLPAVAVHRLRPAAGSETDETARIIEALIAAVPIP